MTQSHYKHLSDRWRARHQDLQRKLWSKHAESLSWLANGYRQLVAGGLGGLMLLAGQGAGHPINLPLINTQEPAVQRFDKKIFLISDLAKILPHEVRPLNTNEEQKISEVLFRSFGLKVTPELEGKRLNRSYGLIGAEQHLARYPGDVLNTHFDPPAGGEDDMRNYWQSGMAPGLGAWRYFAPSKEALTQLDKDREKYYIAVQTFLSKDFNSRFTEYRDFYKYRKMLVVNPNNGRAVVADIADAGPAEWTGKHLGGSPEVMHYLERFDGKQRGPVLYFFIDDPDDKIKLGPISGLSS
ncbi:MAG: hypothetical protein Q7K55_02715 [Candidatus Levybacteria bacterium]|nr:hypothetical protein [Candidatus Levybacteria bacterium]